jgi:hypothetical protein
MPEGKDPLRMGIAIPIPKISLLLLGLFLSCAIL